MYGTSAGTTKRESENLLKWTDGAACCTPLRDCTPSLSGRITGLLLSASRARTTSGHGRIATMTRFHRPGVRPGGHPVEHRPESAALLSEVVLDSHRRLREYPADDDALHLELLQAL